MYFKQLLDERYGCASYVGASRQSHEAAIVDPALIGVIAGLAVLLTRGRYNTGRAIAIAVASSTIAIIISTAFTAYVDIWVSGIATDDAGTTFSKLTLPCIIDLILLPILLVIYNTLVERRKRV